MGTAERRKSIVITPSDSGHDTHEVNTANVKEEGNLSKGIPPIHIKDEIKGMYVKTPLQIRDDTKGKKEIPPMHIKDETKEKKEIPPIHTKDETKGKKRIRIPSIHIKDESKEKKWIPSIQIKDETKDKKRIPSIHIKDETKEKKRTHIPSIHIKHETKEKKEIPFIHLKDKTKGTHVITPLRVKAKTTGKKGIVSWDVKDDRQVFKLSHGVIPTGAVDEQRLKQERSLSLVRRIRKSFYLNKEITSATVKGKTGIPIPGIMPADVEDKRKPLNLDQITTPSHVKVEKTLPSDSGRHQDGEKNNFEPRPRDVSCPGYR